MSSVPGELVAAVMALPIMSLYFSQLDTWGRGARRSAIPALVWHLWSLGYLALGAYFLHRPDMPPMHGHHHRTDAPSSPRVIGIAGLLTAGLCHLCLVRDRYLASAASQDSLQQNLTPQSLFAKLAPAFQSSLIPVVIGLTVNVGLWLLHMLVTNLKTYIIFTGILGCICGVGYLIGCVVAASTIQNITSLNSNPALHPLPFAIQLVGLFGLLADCVLTYLNPDWWGIWILVLIFLGDLSFLAVSLLKTLLKSNGDQSKYTSIPLHDL